MKKLEILKGAITFCAFVLSSNIIGNYATAQVRKMATKEEIRARLNQI